MAQKRLRCSDPQAHWPPGLTKLYDEAMADILLTFPYWTEVTGAPEGPSPEDLARAQQVADRITRIERVCAACEQQRARDAARRLRAAQS